VALLVGVTVLTRAFFLLPERRPQLPRWLRTGLRFAPLGALLALVVPELAPPAATGPALAGCALVGLRGPHCCISWGRRSINQALFAGLALLLALQYGLGW
jgi:branched-subunit amino acid transport protein